MDEELLERLMKASALLSSGLNFKALASLLVEEAMEISSSDLGCLYLYEQPEERYTSCKLIFKKGNYPVPDSWTSHDDFLLFIRECKEAMIVSGKKQPDLERLLLHPKMESGMIFPLSTSALHWGLLFLNVSKQNFYTKKHFLFLYFYTSLAGEKLYTARLIEKIKAELTKAEELNSFQENILSSVPCLLLTLDPAGNIQYFNAFVKRYWQLTALDKGKHFRQVLKNRLAGFSLEQIQNALEKAPLTVQPGRSFYLKEDGEPKAQCTQSPLQTKEPPEAGLVTELAILSLNTDSGQSDEYPHNAGILLLMNVSNGTGERQI